MRKATFHLILTMPVASIVIAAGLTAGCDYSPNQLMAPDASGVLNKMTPARSLRALVVFVRFSDDDAYWPGGCSRSGTEWAASDQLPDMARTILHPSPYGPFADSSMTDYFHRQSNGKLLLYGDTHPEVYTTRYPEAHYERFIPEGLGHLTEEIMEALAGAYDFSEYDADGDGYIDRLMVIIRSMRQPLGGISSLGSLDASRTYDGKKLDSRHGGFYLVWRRPYNVHPQVDLIRWMAHEFGHNLWPQFSPGHLNPIPSNDVPYASSASEDRPHRVVGYALMLGAGWRSADIGGHNIISAFERSLVEGWIACSVLKTSQTIVLRDLYTSSTANCAVIELGNDASRRRVFLSNLQRIGYFNRNHRPPSTDCGHCGNIDQGLMATGLLAEIVDETARKPTRDFLPANNAANVPAECQWSFAHEIYGGNTFGHGTQLTPWTRPNIHGYTHYPPGFKPSWQAIDNIRYTAGHDREMAFDFVQDFRIRPVIRSDSWIGSESANQTISGEMRVLEGSTLTISETVLTFERGNRIAVSGILVVNNATLTSDDTWGGITIMETGQVRIENSSTCTK